MSRQIAASALVVFLLAGTVGWTLNRNADADEATPSPTTVASTTTEPPLAYFSSPHETVIGPAAVVASSIRLDGEEVVLAFELERLAPVADAASVTRFLGFGSVEEVPAGDLETVYLDDWTLITTGGDVTGSTATPAARTARFDVGAEFSMESVTGARLESYGLLVPIDTEFTLDLGHEAVTVAPGVTARLVAVTEQARTIVQVELISERDFNADNLAIAGVGPGWKSAVREAEGRPRWNLTYDFPEAPAPIALRVYGAAWMTIETQAEVSLETGQ